MVNMLFNKVLGENENENVSFNLPKNWRNFMASLTPDTSNTCMYVSSSDLSPDFYSDAL